MIVSETLGLDPEYEKIVDWDHLAEPEDLVDPPVNFDFEDRNKLPDSELKKLNRIEKRLNDLTFEIPEAKLDIRDKTKYKKQFANEFEQFQSELSHEHRDILSSGISKEDKLKGLAYVPPEDFVEDFDNSYTALDIGSNRSANRMSIEEAKEVISSYEYYTFGLESGETEIEELKDILKDLEDLEDTLTNDIEEIYKKSTHLVTTDVYDKKIKELQQLKDDSENAYDAEILNKRIKSYEYKINNAVKEDYILFNVSDTNYLFEALSSYEKEEAEHEELADQALIFYIRLNTEDPVLVKVYKAGDIDDRWELTVVEGDNTALDEMEFDPEFSKMEIITYLTDIYEDIEEVDDEFLDDVIDDKEEIDSDFYGMNESLNFEEDIDPYKALKIGQYQDYAEDLEQDSIGDAINVKKEMQHFGRITSIEIASNDYDGTGDGQILYVDKNGEKNQIDYEYRYDTTIGEYQHDEKATLRIDYFIGNKEGDEDMVINWGEDIIGIIFNRIKELNK